MSPERQQLHTLRTLILKSQVEPLSEAEIVELNELIQSDGGAEEAAALVDQLCAFTDSGSLDSLPITEVLADAFATEGPAVTAGVRSTSPVAGTKSDSVYRSDSSYDTRSQETHRSVETPPSDAWGYWLLALVASNLIVASLAWSLAKPSQTPVASIEVPSAANSPQLVSMTACVWSPSVSSIPTLGKPIQLGETLELVEGIAELRVGEGTRGEALMRIEGPASIFIHDDGQLGLRHGSLTAKSLGTGIESLKVDTPIGEVLVDGNSSIGFVADGSVNEVHLFSGRAIVNPTVMPASASKLVLEEGDAVRFSEKSGRDIEVVMFDASQTSFVSSRSSGFDPLDLGDEYVDAVLDSKPSIYWRFEQLRGDSTQYVQNQGSHPNMNAALIGSPGWRQYRGNRVAELGLSSNASAFVSTELWPPEPLNEYTVELWVKPQLYHYGEMFCLINRESEPGGRHAQAIMLETVAREWFYALKALAPNRIRFVHRVPPSTKVLDGTNLVSESEYQVRVWQHLVAQKQGDRLMLWLNGQLSDELSDPKPLPPNMQILLGQLYPVKTFRAFVGQIDEVAIYDRCLSPEELQGHIRAAGRDVAPEVIVKTDEE